MRARLMLIAGVLLGALALAPARAEACSCAGQGFFGVLMPREGDRVPANARIWVTGFDAATLTLSGPDGESIPFDVSPIDLDVGWIGPQTRLTVLTPREPLAAGEGYSVRHGPAEVISSFSVDEAIDDEAPPAPEVIDIEGDVNEDLGNSCGKYRGVSVTVQAEGLTFVWLADDAGVGPLLLSGHAIEAQPASDGHAYFAYGIACSSSWPGDEILRLRFASFDVAGNRSEESEPVTIDRPDYGASLCSVGLIGQRRGPSALALLFALLLVSLAARAARARYRPRSAAFCRAQASARAPSSPRS